VTQHAISALSKLAGQKALLIVQDCLWCGLAQFDLCAHFLNLLRLLFQLFGLGLSRRFSSADGLVVDAHRADRRRFIVHADEKLSAFVEFQREALTVTFYLETMPDS
jgi:hypothetical protein